MMRRRNTGNMNYRSDAYKDYKEYLRRSNPTLPLPHNAPQYLPPGEQEGKHNTRGAHGPSSPPLGSAPGNSYTNDKDNIKSDPEQNKATQGKKHSLEKRKKKVEFANSDNVIKTAQNTGLEQVYEVKSIDMEASDFINSKRRLFEMAKLASLRGS